MLISWYDCGRGDINLLSLGTAKMFDRMVAACNVQTPELIQTECSKESTIRNWECSGEKWRWSNHIQPQMLELKYRDWDKWLTVCFHRDETSLYYENRILKQSAEGDDWRYCALSWKCDWWLHHKRGMGQILAANHRVLVGHYHPSLRHFFPCRRWLPSGWLKVQNPKIWCL